MVHLEAAPNNIWHSNFNGTRWTPNENSDQKSKASPALATFGGRLHMVHLGNTSIIFGILFSTAPSGPRILKFESIE